MNEYQLVLQWRAESGMDLDALLEIEDRLINELTAPDVDGHDFASNEFNIFILTQNPAGTFEQVVPVLNAMHVLNDARIAYRDVNDDAYTILHPKNLTIFDVT